jgi:triosephosphate isomerase
MRRKMVAGNWKMVFGYSQAIEFAKKMKDKINSSEVDVVLCVSSVSLKGVMEVLQGTNIKVGAQNMHYMDEGAYTGEISAATLGEMGVEYVIIGHSERRERFNETDTTVNLKIMKALEHGLTPIVCIGESQKQRKQNRTQSVLHKQLSFAFDELSPSCVAKTVIAYEPIWAIGTGETATPQQAEDACACVREVFGQLYGAKAAQEIRVLYGGSVTAANAAELFAQQDIDGGLVGGASLKPEFVDVVNAAKPS